MDGPETGDTVVYDAQGRAHDIQGRFVNGHSEYAARKRRIAERLAKLCLDYDPSPAQQMLLIVIAGHLDDAERARTAERRVRAGNASNRLLRLIPKRQRQEEPLMTARELLERITKSDPPAA
jgi:hypothetical protein